MAKDKKEKVAQGLKSVGISNKSPELLSINILIDQVGSLQLDMVTIKETLKQMKINQSILSSRRSGM